MRRAIRNHHSSAHEDYPVTMNGRRVEIVKDNHHRSPGASLADGLFHDALGVPDIQGRCRLVEEQHWRRLRQDAGQ
jgi:hypothetical protein